MPNPLQVLANMYQEQQRRKFPRLHPLPAEFDDLNAEWADLGGFVAGLSHRALAGRRLRPEEVVPYGQIEFRQRLERFRSNYPEISRPFLDEFEFLDRILDLLLQIAEAQVQEEP